MAGTVGAGRAADPRRGTPARQAIKYPSARVNGTCQLTVQDTLDSAPRGPSATSITEGKEIVLRLCICVVSPFLSLFLLFFMEEETFRAFHRGFSSTKRFIGEDFLHSSERFISKNFQILSVLSVKKIQNAFSVKNFQI